MIKYRVRQAMKNRYGFTYIMLRPVGTTGNIVQDSLLPSFELQYENNSLKRVLNLGDLTSFPIASINKWVKEFQELGFKEIEIKNISGVEFSQVEFLNFITGTPLNEEQIKEVFKDLRHFETSMENECL